MITVYCNDTENSFSGVKTPHNVHGDLCSIVILVLGIRRSNLLDPEDSLDVYFYWIIKLK